MITMPPIFDAEVHCETDAESHPCFCKFCRRLMFRHSCRRCAKKGAGATPPPPPCTTKGEVIRTQWCAGCPSTRMEVPVYACSEFGQCARRKVTESKGGKIDPSVHVCFTCDLLTNEAS